MITEHAISHSQNLNNPLLLLFSCLAYAQYERVYDINKIGQFKKNKHLSWTDIFHFSVKKLFFFYETRMLSKKKFKENELDIPRSYEKLIRCLCFDYLSQFNLKTLFLSSLIESEKNNIQPEKSSQLMIEIAYSVNYLLIRKKINLL